MQNRRTFIKDAAIYGSVSSILIQSGCLGKLNTSSKIKDFGIQLYTLRDLFPTDVKGVLSSVAKFGYNQVEGYEDGKGLWWGYTAKEFKKILDDNGLNMVSSHCSYKENLAQKAAEAAEVGLKYLNCPWVGPQKSMDDWKKVTDSFNQAGEICKREGIKFAYHNHEYSFKAFSGMIPHDFIMNNTDPDNVKHQMDIYWVVTSGADPEAFLRKYKGRFTLCHVKDRLANTDEKEASCNLGTGIIDFAKVLRTARECGMEYFIVEQERYDNGSSIQSAEANARYMKGLVI